LSLEAAEVEMAGETQVREEQADLLRVLQQILQLHLLQ
jgi:hypothetical protein